MRKVLIAIVVVAAVAAGAFLLLRGADSGSARGDAPLAFVPADTPYLFANLEPFPADVSARWLEQMDVAARMWQVQIAQGITSLEGTRPDAEELKWLRALHAEFDGKTTSQLFDAIGYDLRGEFALYGIGLAPVMRVALADPDKFRAFIARLEQHSGTTLPRARIGDADYWYVAAPQSPVRGVLAVHGEHLVLTVAPAADEAALGTLLGIERPAADLRDGAPLVALNEKFGYLPYASGYVDSARVVAQLSAAPTPLETAFLTAFGIEKPQPDPICASEYQALASAAPRISAGYTALDAKRMDMVSRIETSAPIAQDLMQLRAPMPGLAAVGEAPLNIGFSVKLAALPTIVNKWTAAVAAAPWRCAALLPLNDGFAQTGTQLANPVVFGAAPVFHGFHAIATRIELKTIDAAPDFAGKLLIGSPNPAALVAMAKSFAPPLATLQLQPDGKVQALPELPNVPAGMPAFVAMSPNVLALAIGTGEDKDLANYLDSDPARQPLFVLGYSGALFSRFNTLMLEQAATLADPKQQEQQRQAAEMIAQIYAQIRRAELRVEFTESGIEMHQHAELN